MRAEGAFGDFDGQYANVYSAEDLAFFKSIFEEVFAAARANGGADKDETELKSKIASAIFRSAGWGVRDPEIIGRAAREAARSL